MTSPSIIADSRAATLEVGLQMLIAAAICAFAYAGIRTGADSMRLLFPALAFAVGAYLLYRGDLPTYLSFVVWIFLLTPFLRRLVDFQVGWETVNLIMLAPYAVAAPSLFVVPLLISRGPKGVLGGVCLAIVFASLYGLLVAMLNGRIASGLLEFLRWGIPPCLMTIVVVNSAQAQAVIRRIEALMIVAVPLLGAYAIYQYVYIPGWDGYWMTNAGMDSIGEPLPYRVRVFSTLNSPGSFASFLLFGLTVLLCKEGWFRWIGVALGSIALLLSLVRSVWLGLVLALCWVAFRGTSANRLSLTGLVAGVVLGLPFLLVLPDVGQIVEQRLQSLNQVSTDSSFEDRFTGFADLGEQLETSVFGQGLGVGGAFQKADGKNTIVIDGGPIEIFLSLGVIGGVVYCISVLLATYRVLSASPRDRSVSNKLSCYQSVAGANVFLLSAGTTTAGEMGVFFWLSIGLAISASRSGDLLETSLPPSLRIASNQMPDVRLEPLSDGTPRLPILEAGHV